MPAAAGALAAGDRTMSAILLAPHAARAMLDVPGMTSSIKKTFPSIDPASLRDICGGACAPAPVPMPNMGAPKYSAAWWDLVRARGLEK